MTKNRKPKVVTQRPLIDCTMSSGLPDSCSRRRLHQILRAAIKKATEMWRNRVAEIAFTIHDWACKIRLNLNHKEHRHHVFGYVFEVKIRDCNITCIIDQQVMSEPELINGIKWKVAVESITLQELRDLWLDHKRYRDSLA